MRWPDSFGRTRFASSSLPPRELCDFRLWFIADGRRIDLDVRFPKWSGQGVGGSGRRLLTPSGHSWAAPVCYSLVRWLHR